MKTIHFLIIIIFYQLLPAQCETGFTEINNDCFYQSDLEVLQTFIDSSTTINMDMDANGNGIIEPLELGIQEWENGRLTYLNFSWYNQPGIGFSGIIPENIGDLTELTYLNFYGNNLSGPLPESIGDLSNLNTLNLGSNNLSGNIPESFCNLEINNNSLNYNSLCPSYPDCIDSNIAFNQDLSSCELIGLICDDGYEEFVPGLCLHIEDTAVLEAFIDSSTYINMLWDKNENGIIEPLELGYQNWNNGRLTYLSCFWYNLPGYGISGKIPENIGNLTELTHLNFYGNNLSGPLPESIGELNNLTTLNLQSNNLSGNIPESIGNLINLNEIDLGYNEFSGNLPENIGDLIHLTRLELRHNNLTGLIPESIYFLSDLLVLDLAGNSFYGDLSEDISNLELLRELRLGYNNLTGNIPEGICNLTELYTLSSYHVNFSGNIPECIDEMTSLRSINFSNNNLTGSIPENICSLNSIESLQLAYNNLTGFIPECICNYEFPYINVKFYYNQLCPPFPNCSFQCNTYPNFCVQGCMNSDSPNYDENANNDDGSCIFYYSQTFNTGNNLISFTGVPNPSTVAEFLDDYPVNFILGQGQGLFHIDGEWSGNLTNFDGYSGYWVNASESFELQYNLSNTFDTCEEYPLSIGNNLVSYIGTNNQNTLTGLSGEDNYTDHINFIISQGQGLFNSNGEWSGNLTNLNKNNGYWLNLKSSWPFENANGNKIFRWGIGEDCTEPEESSNLIKESSKIPEEFQFAQSTEQTFYLIKEIEEIETGDIITAYCGEQLVGSAIWDGEYTAIPVMGRDISEQTVGFCDPGEKPQFFWNKDQGEGKTELAVALSPSKGKIPGFVNLGVYTIDKLESVENEILPTEWSLSPAYPNPFNPITTIEIGVPFVETQRAASQRHSNAVSLQVFDINGRLIKTLNDGHLEPGFHSIEWDATGHPSGVYFVKMVAGDPSINSGQGYTKSQKLMLVK